MSDFAGKGIFQWIEAHKDDMIECVRSLVRIPTINTPPTGNELPGQALFERMCREIGLEIFTVNPADFEGGVSGRPFLEGRSYKGRYNVVGLWRGTGQGRSLLLSGHMDVVPEAPLPWTECSPFEPVVKNGRMYGRGTADMKGGLASAFMAIKLLKHAGWTPSGDIWIESVVDEEFASGNGTIASRLAGFNADFAINMEPTGLRLYPACAGALLLKVTVRGTAGMPYTEEAMFNPIYGITKVVDLLRKYEAYRNAEQPVHPLWASASYKRSIIVTKLKAGEVQEHGQLSTPIDAWIETVIQTFPGETESSAMTAFLKYFKEEAQNISELDADQISFEKVYRYVEPSECAADHPGVRMLKRCCQRTAGDEVVVVGAPFSCDLSYFQKYGSTPAVLFGPTGGNLHAPNEWVDVDSVVTATKVYADMIMNWCGSSAMVDVAR